MLLILARAGSLRRFGLITTNSIRQKFGRRVIQTHLDGSSPLSLVYAVPDHPWVDDAAGADVRIAMTVGGPGRSEGVLERVVREEEKTEGGPRVTLAGQEGLYQRGSDCRRGCDQGSCTSGQSATAKLSWRQVTWIRIYRFAQEAESLGLGRIAGLEKHIRPYLNGRDLNQRSRNVMVIDLLGLAIDEVKDRFPEVHQWVLNRVKPERDAKARGGTRDSIQYARDWWLFGKTRSDLREAIKDLSRYIATVETSKHRVFSFLDKCTSRQHADLHCSGSPFFLGVLSSRIHVVWSLAAGGAWVLGTIRVTTRLAASTRIHFRNAWKEQRYEFGRPQSVSTHIESDSRPFTLR